MRRDGGVIAFRPVAAADLPMLREWIARPHWQEWWGEPGKEVAMIRDMVEGRDTTRPFIFHVDGSPAGYIQYWTVADQLFEPWLTEAPWMTELPQGAIGVDISIADPQALSKGMGTAVLKAFVAGLVADGHRDIYIDPDPANLRAVRSYGKAGFVTVPELAGRTGDYQIMKLDLNTVSVT